MPIAKWRKFTRQEIEQFVQDSFSWRHLGSKLGYSTETGSYLTALRTMVKELDLDISHFTGQGWNKNNFDYSRFQKDTVIKSSQAINALIYLRGHRCENCNIEFWLGQPTPLEVHHIDGDHLNNEIDNLQLVCPNCHALTDNYRGKNINKKQKISENDFVTALQQSSNIRQALKMLGLTTKGGNYQRARELIFKYNITHLLAGAPGVETA